jgi:hypothetical protein
MEIALLFYMQMIFIPHRPSRSVTRIALLTTGGKKRIGLKELAECLSHLLEKLLLAQLVITLSFPLKCRI